VFLTNLLRLFGLEDRSGGNGLMNIPLLVCFAEWAFFMLYWSAAAKNSSQAKVSESRQSRRVHELLLNAAFLLAILPIPGLRQRFLPDISMVVWAGLVLQTGSFVLGVWARRALGRHWSGEITIKVDHRLIRTGPYRLVRHPIYTAWLGMFASTAIVSGQMHAVLGFAMAAFAYWRKIRLEEANLKNAFGPDYEAYRRETRTLIPWLL
jgi:protein-S-isoprenylcysteine O-methyltransferase Ste14